MSTTALVVEIVIIGAQVLVWLTLAFISIFGINWSYLAHLKDWVGIISLGLLAIAYTVGMVFDTVVASFFAPWAMRSWHMPWTREYHSVPPSEMRVYLMLKHHDAFLHLEKQFNQSRLLRATVFNLLPVGVFSSILYFRSFQFSWRGALAIGLLLSCLIITFISWTRTLRVYYYNLSQMYGMAVAKKRQPTKRT